MTMCRPFVVCRLALPLLCVVAMAHGGSALARESGDPIVLGWTEGDVAGMQPIFSGDGRQTIGFIEYHQHRQGDVLTAVRVARFQDGSSDEDEVEARIGTVLTAVRGRSIIRDTQGRPTVDLEIDVPGGHISGFSDVDGDRETYDEAVQLPPGTYWGPLIFIVVKNFDQNQSDGRVVFRTVAPTPRPRVIDMELVSEGASSVTRPGGRLDVVTMALRPTINWLIDPIIQRIAPKTVFFIQPGVPPALARFDGPRNYGGQEMRLE
jgi:hypothetical protein